MNTLPRGEMDKGGIRVFLGSYIHSQSKDNPLVVKPKGVIGVEKGKDDEDLLLYSLLNKKSYFHHLEKRQKPFNLDDLTEEFCWIHFRFRKHDLQRLKCALGIPDDVICSNTMKIPGMEALCILLKRLAYPNRYADLMPFFPRTRCEISRVFNRMVDLIYTAHVKTITDFSWIREEDMIRFATALTEKGSPYKDCIGFVDGTIREICRPSINPREFYNGHKRLHAIKFQSFSLPDGMIAQLHGPIPGRRHDAFLLESSKLIDKLDHIQTGMTKKFHIYGDLGYPLLPTLITPFRGQNLTDVQQNCNKIMSSLRESVEWAFMKVIQKFGQLDYGKNLKIGMQPVGQYYAVGVILTNAHNCLYGNQTSEYFNCQPPTLETYFN